VLTALIKLKSVTAAEVKSGCCSDVMRLLTIASQDEQIITGQEHSALQAQSSGQQQSIPQLHSIMQPHSALAVKVRETTVKHNVII
jgi:hypothetical protein